ncbi:GNAT family N-acetyltransferase [Patulibacter defluvii]|uniref:GNAT family N-acetyltransferase n=1 Tax=Patulibacter defluvii TaxID=3095358 RepID=UPI002A748476|nr:GNAT family N-acetyltransferase [Patulibacter sp. DM4]
MAGSSSVARVVPATELDRAAIVGTLSLAFADDPVLNWVFPRVAARERCAPHFFSFLADRLLPDGESWTTEGGAALWASPGHWRETPRQLLGLGRATAGGAWPHWIRIARGLGGLEARHPREPHMYLAAIGVRADRRGRGLGSALLAPALARCDERGLPAYLESSNPLNVSLYERHGFVATERRTLPHGPPVTLMWRPASG